eukprot:154766-Ditylum_brightwellii.AAC.1
MSEWDHLIPQCSLTSNLLGTSRVNLKLSAQAYLYGNFDFNATSLTPLGTRVVVHKKTAQRDSWQYHGLVGWYIGPSPNHYKCLQCYIPTTTAEIDADTVYLIARNIPIPSFSDKEALNQALHGIMFILKMPEKSNIPQFWKGAPIQQAFQQ